MRAMELGVVAWLTDRGVGIAELAAVVEQAGLGFLFLTEHTHVPAGTGCGACAWRPDAGMDGCRSWRRLPGLRRS